MAGGTTLLPLVIRLTRLESIRGRVRGRASTGNGRVNGDVVHLRLRADQCYRCGGDVADALARLGSTLCHDCRDASPLPAR